MLYEVITLTFVNGDDMYKFQQIEELIGSEVYKAPLPPELGEGPEWKVIQKKKKKKRNYSRNNNPTCRDGG